jgi:VCBS repeat-containing protein
MASRRSTGQLTSSDVDNADNVFQAVSDPAASDNGYGTYTVTEAGLWTYTLDNDNAAVQALNDGETLSDTFTVYSEDGTPQVVTITIEGTDDAAVIGGDTTGTVVEAGGAEHNDPDGIPTVTGQLTSSDVDNADNVFQAVSDPAASDNGYGTYTVTEAGLWTYTLDNDNAAVQALNDGETLSDTFTVYSEDGTPQVVTITIEGTDDAAVIGGDTTGTVVEAGGAEHNDPDGIPTVTGQLTSSDVDNADNVFQAVSDPAASDNGYGTYTVTEAGLWTYTLDNDNAAVQALNDGETLSDTFTVYSEDGTPQVVTITIEGTDDAAVIGGDTTGTVVEAGGAEHNDPDGIPTVTGQLTSSDVDNADNVFQAVSDPAASDNGYGTYTVTEAGLWTYTLDNDNAAVQALNDGETLSDTFTVYSEDGTPQVVTITIEGTDDAAVIGGDTTGTVVEAGGAEHNDPDGIPTVTGQLTSSDVDNADNVFQAATRRVPPMAAGRSMTEGGNWTYTLDNDNAAVQALNDGDTLEDTFTVYSEDGTPQVVTITIEGTDDAAVIGGDTTGTVVEAGGAEHNDPDGTPTATGQLTSSDVDNADNVFQAASRRRVTPTAAIRSMTEAGQLDLHARQRQRGGPGAQRRRHAEDTFTVYSEDGTPQVVTITIEGTDDAAVIGGDTTGTVVEAGGAEHNDPEGTPTATGQLTSSDVDNADNVFQAVSVWRRCHLWQLDDRCRRGQLDLYARQRQRGGPGAQRRRHAGTTPSRCTPRTARRRW